MARACIRLFPTVSHSLWVRSATHVEPSLLQRALANAPERSTAQVARPDEEFFVFRVGDLTLGVRSEHVREVTRMGPLTPLPRSPSFLLGVVGHRGEVVPLVDLLRFLSQGESKPSNRSRLFISESGGQVVGFLADHVIGLRRIFVADKMPAPAGGGSTQEFLDGVVQSRELGALNLLHLPRIVQSARQKSVAR
ncbi:MAG: chemotaxis protein CheW [Archangium gephyra]|uniref:Chemotaxis protein CheW n=1 Tax=Archangium gephyra TaxID=48 RepID=A0A2W5TRQ9_9BACT|nr:MAG: chemotaxis protein CheW [Archangium gephyra]